MLDHVKIPVKDYEEGRKFYDTAIAAGASDNGAPGVRSEIHPNYYAAFVHDPNGHNIEAVCHAPE